MAHKTEKIVGTVYSADFFPGEDASVAYSDAVAVIEPPVNLGDEYNVVIECVFNDRPKHAVTVNHLVTTASKTVIEIEVKDQDRTEYEPERTTHEQRLESAREGLIQYIGFLNRVEGGTFDGSTFNV